MGPEEIKRKVADTLEEEKDIAAAYLFGSFAKGLQQSESDVDIAVLYEEEVEDIFSRTTELQEKISRELDREVDLRALNDQDTRFTYNVLREGETILSNNDRLRTDFEREKMRKYLDMKPFYQEYDSYVKKRLTA